MHAGGSLPGAQRCAPGALQGLAAAAEAMPPGSRSVLLVCQGAPASDSRSSLDFRWVPAWRLRGMTGDFKVRVLAALCAGTACMWAPMPCGPAQLRDPRQMGTRRRCVMYAGSNMVGGRVPKELS